MDAYFTRSFHKHMLGQPLTREVRSGSEGEEVECRQGAARLTALQQGEGRVWHASAVPKPSSSVVSAGRLQWVFNMGYSHYCLTPPSKGFCCLSTPCAHCFPFIHSCTTSCPLY
jgi:hypothetical protein